MYIYTHIYIHIYVYIHIHTYVCVYIYSHLSHLLRSTHFLKFLTIPCQVQQEIICFQVLTDCELRVYCEGSPAE